MAATETPIIADTRARYLMDSTRSALISSDVALLLLLMMITLATTRVAAFVVAGRWRRRLLLGVSGSIFAVCFGNKQEFEHLGSKAEGEPAQEDLQCGGQVGQAGSDPSKNLGGPVEKDLECIKGANLALAVGGA